MVDLWSFKCTVTLTTGICEHPHYYALASLVNKVKLWQLVISIIAMKLPRFSPTTAPGFRVALQSITAKLHYTDTGYEHQLYEHHQPTKICHIPTSWHVDMLGSGIAMWQICCRIVVSLSVGGVRSRCPCSGVWLLPYFNITESVRQHKSNERNLPNRCCWQSMLQSLNAQLSMRCASTYY